jgi:hypothetical protein
MSTTQVSQRFDDYCEELKARGDLLDLEAGVNYQIALQRAYRLGKSVQRTDDWREEERARSQRIYAYLMCAGGGFVAGLLLAGALTFIYRGLQL